LAKWLIVSALPSVCGTCPYSVRYKQFYKNRNIVLKRNIQNIILINFLILLPFLHVAGQNDIEDSICNCIYKSFDSIGVNFKSLLFDYEKYLIETNQIPDSSGESYLNLYEAVIKEGCFPIESDYYIKSFTHENYVLFARCFYSPITTPELQESDSKIKILFEKFSKIHVSGNEDPKMIAEIILNTLNESDFEKEIYRIYALHTIYHTTTSLEKIRKVISIEIFKNEQVFLNGQLIETDRIAEKIYSIIKNYSDFDKENYLVSLEVDGQVTMRVVTEVKTQLREANALRINYKLK
jgi:hypothetical protein